MKVISLLICLTGILSAQLTRTEGGKVYHAPPGAELKYIQTAGLAEARVKVIAEALKVRAETQWPKYVFGSADPEKGGFDCSGVIYYTLRRIGYNDVPRTSSDQYLWLKKSGKIHHVGNKVTSLTHPDFKNLRPGDLVFWSGTYSPTDGRKTKVTHVGLYLGRLQGYKTPVMLCASKGRYFNGKRQDGYGLFDFKVPSKTSKSKIVAYGSLHNY